MKYLEYCGNTLKNKKWQSFLISAIGELIGTMFYYVFTNEISTLVECFCIGLGYLEQSLIEKREIDTGEYKAKTEDVARIIINEIRKRKYKFTDVLKSIEYRSSKKVHWEIKKSIQGRR
ncbi:hypothetical protein [Clostridium estertheticum]|uniref:hypothetical protein n=1 Tax=Clostridium estertheticum TaxID=238834 RepID=UPI001C0E5892|nr:hypothetical protein [Clostridium estertheticum]MBU3072835.1 hypothetical protein [Clostridium estertheticum]MBU3163128.1 hypothetical protein [Clostridium estertheticum]